MKLFKMLLVILYSIYFRLKELPLFMQIHDFSKYFNKIFKQEMSFLGRPARREILPPSYKQEIRERRRGLKNI